MNIYVKDEETRERLEKILRSIPIGLLLLMVAIWLFAPITPFWERSSMAIAGLTLLTICLFLGPKGSMNDSDYF